MWAVYLCGCTDCFLHALFMYEKDAIAWANENSVNPEGFLSAILKTRKILIERILAGDRSLVQIHLGAQEDFDVQKQLQPC